MGLFISQKVKRNTSPMRRSPLDRRREIMDFLAGFTVETTPGSAAKTPDFREQLRPGTTVYIAYLPGSDFKDTIKVAYRLRSEGFNPVPHICARSTPSKAVLDESLRRLTQDAGVTRVLAIAGAVPAPLGEFHDTMQMLDTGLFDKHGIQSIGVAGHPEGSPDMSDAAIRQALHWKNDFSERTDADIYIVTQFCFDVAPIIEWDKRLRMEGNRLPIHIGIPGPATIKTLMGYAKACGIGPSMRLISRQARNVAKLLAVSAPDKLVAALAAYKATHPDCGIAAAHIFSLGGLKKSADWSYAVVDGRFSLSSDATEFTVN